jgi:hypothetical protein
VTRRLRDLDSPEAGEARLVELLRAAEPTVRSDAHMRRVRVALDAAPSRARGRLRWSASVALPLLLLAGVAAASAASGLVWLQRHRGASEASRHEGERRAERGGSGVRAILPPPAEIAATPIAKGELEPVREPSGDRERRLSSPAPATTALTTVPRRSARSVVERGRARGSAPSGHVALRDAVPSAEDAAPDRSPLRGVGIVSSAVGALRRSHEPKVASELLEDYLHEEPHGPFAEEALGLAIEAAVEGEEPERAVSRARQYLATYPSGRFLAVAQRALRRFSASVDLEPRPEARSSAP